MAIDAEARRAEALLAELRARSRRGLVAGEGDDDDGAAAAATGAYREETAEEREQRVAAVGRVGGGVRVP